MRNFLFTKTYGEGRWYIDLPEWTGEKADLEMVAGADTMLDFMAEGDNKVIVCISETEFENSEKLQLKGMAEDIGSGAYYFLQKYRGVEVNLTLWLCDVTLFVFNNKFPTNIFMSPIKF
jgi:hypothetical protein